MTQGHVTVGAFSAFCVWLLYETKFWEDGPWWRRQFVKGFHHLRTGRAYMWQFLTSQQFPTHETVDKSVVVKLEQSRRHNKGDIS